MQRDVGRLLQPLVVIGLMISFATPTGAEPITALYAVEVTRRRVGQSSRDAPPSEVTEPFQFEFDLLMTFDPAEGPGPSGTYGPASFSSVPLPLPWTPADLPPLEITGMTAHGVQIGPRPGHFAQAREIQQASKGTLGGEDYLRYYAETQLEWSQTGGSLPPRVFTPESFLLHLTLRGDLPSNFRYRGEYWSGGGTISRVIYSGNATLLETSVVPEPATFLLTGGGLAAVLRHRSKRRKLA